MGRSSHSRREETSAESSASSIETEICVCESGPDQLVFIEDGNTDAWIATDTTVDRLP